MNGYRFYYRLATALLLTAGLFLLAGCQALKGDATQGTVQLGTATLNFGTVIVNTTSTLGDTITNNTTSSVTIASIQGLTSEFQVNGLTLPVTLAAGQVTSFSVVFQPTAVGDPTITISFRRSKFAAHCFPAHFRSGCYRWNAFTESLATHLWQHRRRVHPKQHRGSFE